MRFPRAVVFGSTSFGGMGWDSMFSIQLYEKVKYFTRNVRIRSRLGNLIQAATETAQIFAGISSNVLNTNTKWSQWCPLTWITSLSIGLQSIDAGIDTNFMIMKPIREYDRNLMDIFYGWQYTTLDLKQLNMCRVYLQVVTVADITSMDGTTLEHQYIDCKKTRKSTLTWPNQVEPPKSAKTSGRKPCQDYALHEGY